MANDRLFSLAPRRIQRGRAESTTLMVMLFLKGGRSFASQAECCPSTAAWLRLGILSMNGPGYDEDDAVSTAAMARARLASQCLWLAREFSLSSIDMCQRHRMDCPERGVVDSKLS
jgi:hypothetical protein